MDLIIVSDPSDYFSIEVVEIVKQKGYDAVILGVCEAARLFSISVDSGYSVVTPDLPLLLRLPPPPAMRTSFDDSFEYGECFATLWAAAALSKSTVLNRPSSNGFGGRTSNSSVLTKLRAGLSEELVEVFSLLPPSPPTELVNQQWYVQDVVTHRTSAWPTIPDGKGPYRARWSDIEPAYEMVVVLADKAWRCTTVALQHLKLEQTSISLIKRLELTFGAVIWSISHNLADATLVCVNPFPSMQQVQFIWPALAPAMLEVFFP